MAKREQNKRDRATDRLYEALVVLLNIDAGYFEEWTRKIKQFGGQPPQLCKATFEEYRTAYNTPGQAKWDRLTAKEQASISHSAQQAARGHATPFTPFLINPFYHEVDDLPAATDLLLTSIKESILFVRQLKTSSDAWKAQKKTQKGNFHVPKAELLAMARRFYHIEEFLNHGREDWRLFRLGNADNYYLGEAVADLSDIRDLTRELGGEFPDTILPDIAEMAGKVVAKLKSIRIVCLHVNAIICGIKIGKWQKGARDVNHLATLMEGTELADDDGDIAEKMLILSLGGEQEK